MSPLVSETTAFRGACPHDFPDTCAWTVSVRDGRATAVEADHEHPFTAGGLCTKVNRFLEDRVYHLGRLLTPLRRTGAKGSGAFVPIGWDEAIDEIATRLADVIVEHGAEEDLSPMMLRALARRSSTGSLTVLGDLAQATTPWATRSWAEALGHLGKPDSHVEQLTRGFRVPGEVIEYAARLLPVIAPGLEPQTSVRRARGELEIVPFDSAVEVVERAIGREGSIGVIVPDAMVDGLVADLTAAGVSHGVIGRDPAPAGAEGAGVEATEFDQHLDVVPATLAKGLEFDHVVLLEPAATVVGEPDRVAGLRRLYVCLTRAVTSLVIAHDQPLPAELDPR